jgi:hypothetical protein
MTRREKAQQAILSEINSRPNDELGTGAPPLELDEYESATVTAIAREMAEIEHLIEAEMISDEEGTVTAVIPHGLTERGTNYLDLLRQAS